MVVSFANIQIGSTYTRYELAALWGYAGIAAISRGVVTPQDDDKIILFVTRKKRKGDAQFHDDLVGSVLLWEGPNDHFAEERMLNHQQTGDPIHVFYRDLHEDPFTYVGPMTMYCGQRF
jgi:hypothetical protein